MKLSFLFALILTEFTVYSQDAAVVQVTQTTTQTVVTNQPTVGGLLPAVLTVPAPAQMINPFAPPQYGSGLTFVIYGNRDLNTSNHSYERRLHPDGLRLLTLRSFW